jgi:NTE family protein
VLRSMEHADILVTVDVAGFSTMGFSKADQIIPKGTEAAEARAGVLTRLSLSDDEWRQYRARREARIVKTAPTPQFVEVKGSSEHRVDDLQQEFSTFAGQPVDTAQLERKITQQVGLGRLNSMSYGLMDRNGSTGLLVTAEEKDYSPPWFQPGITIDGSDPGNVQFTIGGRMTFLDVGGYRSELRADFAVGSTYSFATEYYHPLKTTSRWFVAPRIYASKSPVDLYSDSELLAVYKVNQVGGGVDVGYAFNRYSEFRFGYQAGYSNLNRWVGSTLLPDVSGRTGRTRFRYAMDRLDNPIIPRSGTAILLDGGWTDANPGALKGFPSSELTIETFRTISKPGSVYFVGAGGTSFGHNNIGVPPFSLGGPSRMAAYGVNEFLTDQYFYLRAGYLHKLWELPALLGKGVYLDGHYEAGRPYNTLSAPTGVISDGVVGLITQTVLGPMTIGGSIGGGGHAKWFFQLGHLF